MSKRLFSTTLVTDSDSEQFRSPASVILSLQDYPLPYRGLFPGSKLYALPTDYKVDDQAIRPEVFLFKGNNSRNRLFLRTSFLLTEGKFTAATFFLDTGLGSHFQLSDDLYGLLVQHNRVIRGGPTDFMEVNINGVKHQCLVQNDLPHVYKSANIIGLPMCFALGFKFNALNINVVPMEMERIAPNQVKFEPFEFL